MPFKKVTFGDLDDLTGVVQCMDDQWVPRAVLEQMARNDQRRRDFEDVVAASARREFMSSGVEFRWGLKCMNLANG